MRRMAFAALVLSFWVLSCCDRPFEVVFSATLSGEKSELGVSARNGALLAAEQINMRGGIGGQKIDLIFADSGGTKTQAIENDVSLIKSGKKIIVGHVISGNAQAVYEAVKNMDVLIISPTSASSFFTGKDDVFIRVCPEIKKTAELLAEYCVRRGFSSLSVIYDKNNLSYTRDYYECFRGAAQQTGMKVYGVEFDSATRKHSSAALRAAARIKDSSSSGGVLIVASGYDSAIILQVLRRIGVKNIFASSWSMTEDFLKYGGNAVEGVVGSHFYDLDASSPGMVEFINSYARRFGDKPSFSAIFGYDSINLLASSLDQKRLGCLSPSEVKRAILSKKNFDSPMGPFSINGFGDAERQSFLFEIKSQKFVKIDVDGSLK